MFDLSFSELLVIGFVALVVIGPEKLPKVARTAGAFFGRMQRFVAQVKNEVNREARFEELQTLQDEVKSSLQEVQDDFEQSILSTGTHEVESDVGAESKPVKKPRKARQPKANTDTGSEEAKPIRSEVAGIEETTSQAELFSDADTQRPKPRRTRKSSASKVVSSTSIEQ